MKIRKVRRILYIREFMIDSIQIIIGTLVMAIGVSLFLLPNQLSSGGFSGIATITYYLFKFPVGWMIILLNIPLLILAFFRIGKEYLLKGIIGTIALSIFIDIFDKINPLTNDRFLSCIYGGVIMGVGTAIVLRVHGSTGGTDLLSAIIRSFKPSFKTSSLLVILDIIIVILNVMFFKEVEIGLYSTITIYMMGKLIDVFFEGIYFTKVMFIVSDKYEDIAQKIGTMIGRGSTGIYAKGMYKQEEKMMLMCIVSRSEVYKIKTIARKVDKNSFIVITNAREVVGKGFKRE